MEKPCYSHASHGRQAGGRAGAGSWAPAPPRSPPPRPHSQSILGVVRNIRRLPCPPPPIRSPATEKLSLAFPILMPLKSLGCGQGRRAGELTLKGVSAAWSQG